VGRRRVEDIDLTDWMLDEATAGRLDEIVGRPKGESLNEAELAAPKFSEYPSAMAHAPAVAASELKLPSGPRATRDQDALAAALGEAPNFAGHFSLVKVGCGANCEEVALLDRSSGTVTYPEAMAPLPAAAPCAWHGPVQYRRDSRLITVTAREGQELVTRYYVLDPQSHRLHLLASLASALEERCRAP
jgi:hypothetical protein